MKFSTFVEKQRKMNLMFISTLIVIKRRETENISFAIKETQKNMECTPEIKLFKNYLYFRNDPSLGLQEKWLSQLSKNWFRRCRTCNRMSVKNKHVSEKN